MGKTKISVVGEVIPDEEKKKKERQEARRAAREAEKKAAMKVAASNEATKVAASNAAKEAAGDVVSKDSGEVEVAEEKGKDTSKAKSKYAAKKGFEKKESPRYKGSSKEVDSGTLYPLDTALSILKKFKAAKFDETVELHINTRENKVSGAADLPHGTGKKLRIKIADDAILADVEKGTVDFDILVATPDMMPKLAKVARILGPRGLMPNPKNGTVTQEPEKAVEKLAGGSVNFKTEAKAPIIHLSVGKKSFEEKKLSENVKAVITAIGTQKIKSATLTSTMNPGIRLDVTKC